MRNKKTLRNKKKIRSKQKGGTDKGEEGPEAESEMTTQRARLGFGASVANMVEDERAAIENKPVFEIYACLQEKYPDGVMVTNSRYSETVGYENIPVNANFSNYLSGVLKEKLNKDFNKDFKEYLTKESEASQYDIKLGELKHLQDVIKKKKGWNAYYLRTSQ